MKKKLFLVSLSLLTFSFVLNRNAFGQLDNIGGMTSLISIAKDDATALLKSYLLTYGNAFCTDLNSGWYNTAKVHKVLGFDLTMTISASLVPSSDKTFDLSKIGLKSNPTIQGGLQAPTIAGKNEAGPRLTYRHGGETYASFNTPNGTGWGVIPAPTIQLGIGLVKETELIGRLLPKVKIGDFGSVNMWGIGVKHSLKQWIPGIKRAPFFNLSVLLAYSKLKTVAPISLSPDIYINSGATRGTVTESLYRNQQAQLDFNGFTGNVIASFDLPVITFYAGAGLSKANSSLKLTGDYPFAGLENNGNLVVDDKYKMTDPLSMDITDGKLKPRLNAGFKLKMAIVTWHVEYTLASYQVITTGLGISFR